MKKYSGTYICPHCEEKFSWEYIDTGYRGGPFTSEVQTVDDNTSIAKCDIVVARTGLKALCGYCTHCQMFVEIDDTGNIPRELFS